MKKYLLLIAAVFSFTATFSQSHFYLGFGYNLGYAKLEGLNTYGVDRYNATRTPPVDTSWTTFNEMGNLHFPNGFCASLGGSGGKLMYDISWVGRHMNRTAGGTKVGYEATRELKWRMNTFNLGLGVALGQSRRSRVNIGVSIDLGSEKVFTRLKENGVYVTEDFDLIQKDLVVGSTIFIQIILSSENLPGGLFIRPYIQLPYFKTNYYSTHNVLDANNDIDYDAAESNSWNVGVQLQIGLFSRRDD
jgi:hypothetical protein